MGIIKVFVRGHGGEESQKMPPSKDLPIDLITIGEMGCTMSDEVADAIIFNHLGVDTLKSMITKEELIYWTHEERDNYYNHKVLKFSKPKLDITLYNNIYKNLVLEGDRTIGECGVCYWNAFKSELEWIITLQHKETITLAEILYKLEGMLDKGITIELYWTACMSAPYWHGSKKKVSFNPTKKLVSA